MSLPPHVHFYQLVYCHYAYYGSLVAIHSILVHPWNTITIQIEPGQREEYLQLAATSAEVFVESTRNFIRNLPQIKVNVSTPKW